MRGMAKLGTWCLLLGACIACAPDPAIRIPPSDDVLTDTAAVDVEFDGTDSVTDTISDAPEPPDADVLADTAPDVPADCPVIGPSSDVTTTGDVPYWVSHDVDLDGLGVVTACGPCSDVFRTVKPGDAPIGPACGSVCPGGQPCTCGACPWVEAPAMHFARYRAKAIWTGEEVQIYGTDGFMGAPVLTFSAERWNPSTDDKFAVIDLPFAITYTGYQELGYPLPIWTGAETLVLMNQLQFTVDAKTHVATPLPLAPAVASSEFAAVWAGDALFWWGKDRQSFYAFKSTPRLISWRKKDGWQDLPFPSDFLMPTAHEPRCIAALDGDVYVFDPGNPRNPAAGLDPAKPVMLRYSPGTQVWSALPQTMPADARCNVNDRPPILFQSFPDGIAFIPLINLGYVPPAPAVGEIWWKATGKWTAMAPPPLTGPLSAGSRAIWTGADFLITDVTYVDPVMAGNPSTISWDFPTWPIRYDPFKDEFRYVTSVGYPKCRRGASSYVHTGNEIIMLGGIGGVDVPAYFNEVFRVAYPKP